MRAVRFRPPRSQVPSAGAKVLHGSRCRPTAAPLCFGRVERYYPMCANVPPRPALACSHALPRVAHQLRQRLLVGLPEAAHVVQLVVVRTAPRPNRHVVRVRLAGLQHRQHGRLALLQQPHAQQHVGVGGQGAPAEADRRTAGSPLSNMWRPWSEIRRPGYKIGPLQ